MSWPRRSPVLGYLKLVVSVLEAARSRGGVCVVAYVWMCACVCVCFDYRAVSSGRPKYQKAKS